MEVHDLLPRELIEVPEIPQADAWLAERVGDIEAESSDAARFHELIVLVGAWYQHVAKLHTDLPFGDEDRTVWGAYDLVAAVTIRSKLEKELGRAVTSRISRVRSAVDEVDQVFRSFTESDKGARLTRLGEATPEPSEWWWARIPTGGPARREIDRFMQ